MQRFDIIIVGGGFAGLNALLAAARQSRGRASIAMVSPDTHMVVRPKLYQAAPESAQADLRPRLAAVGATFIQAAVTEIDAARRMIGTADGRLFGYRSMVFAAGSVGWRPPIDGIEHSHGIDGIASATRFDRHLRAIAAGGPTIAVLGSGLAGVELACELRTRIRHLAGAAAAAAARIHLVEQAPAIAPQASDALRAEIISGLAASGVEPMPGERVLRILPGALVLAGAGFVRVDAVVSCTGMRAAPATGLLPGPHDAIGRVSVPPTLAVAGADGLFVAGDAAAVEAAPKRVAPQSCQHALQMGLIAGTNAARFLADKPLLSYRQPLLLTCVDLGEGGAVLARGVAQRPISSGIKGRLAKRAINDGLIQPPDPISTALLSRGRTPRWLEQTASPLLFDLYFRSGAMRRLGESTLA